MEALQHRRKAVTYGKSRKRLQVESIFDDEDISRSHTQVSTPPELEAFKVSVAKKRTPDGIEVRGHQGILLPHGHHPRLVSPLNTDQSQDSSDSSSSQSSLPNGSAKSSILDMPDSDEEACAQQLQPMEIKRRKVTSLKKGLRPVSNARIKKRDHSAAAKETHKHRSKPLGQKKSSVPRQVGNTILKETNPLRHDVLDPSAKQNNTGASVSSSNTRMDRQTRARQMESSNSSSLDLLEVQWDEADQNQGGVTIQHSPARTPRKRRNLQNSDLLSRHVASPSQLGLTSLQLTPEKNYHFSNQSLASDFVTPRRAREKLTDRLDAPKERDSQSASPGTKDVISEDLGKTLATKSTLVPRAATLESVAFADVPMAPGTKIAVNDKSKLTYAKERSHLSDMVDEIDVLKALPPSQLPAVSATLLIEEVAVGQRDDSNTDNTAATAVRSIHELRQAGITNRFERDLETLFEDIEQRTSASKTLRIRALLQLIQKLNQPSFARQFGEVGMPRRLAKCAKEDVDIVSGVLMVNALTHPLLSDHMSAQHLLACFQALVSLSASMLGHNRPFVKIVTDRKQNLSKVLSRELVDVGETSKVGPLPVTISWTPQHAALFALEQSLRNIKVLKAIPAEIPRSLFDQVLALLGEAAEIDEPSESQQHVMTAALSILEFSATSRVSTEYEEYGEIFLDYVLLADVVERIMASGTADSPNLRSIALRLVVSLTNNEPTICAALAETDLIPAVFMVVEHELPPLSDSADRGDEFDNGKLDSVIMALGCLLNLADCSGEARKRMHTPSSTSSSIVQWLVSVFNERAGKAAEATTIAQSQVLVAFGYMSMLLCTLSLDDDVYGYVAQSIQGQSVMALCIEAEEFLDKLETVAKLNPNDPATSTFNERFRSILVNLSTRKSH